MMLYLGSSSPPGHVNLLPCPPLPNSRRLDATTAGGGGSTGGVPVDGLGVPPGSHPGGPEPKEELASI